MNGLMNMAAGGLKVGRESGWLLWQVVVVAWWHGGMVAWWDGGEGKKRQLAALVGGSLGSTACCWCWW